VIQYIRVSIERKTNILLLLVLFVFDVSLFFFCFFFASPSTHQLSLRHADRAFFCKRIGTRQIYYMQVPAPASCFDVEQEAKKVLFEEYGMRIL
jgi:hypothetical protein